MAKHMRSDNWFVVDQINVALSYKILNLKERGKATSFE
jgi:hypothetical protein